MNTSAALEFPKWDRKMFVVRFTAERAKHQKWGSWLEGYHDPQSVPGAGAV